MKKSSIPQEARLVPGYRLDDRYELLYPYCARAGNGLTVWLAALQEQARWPDQDDLSAPRPGRRLQAPCSSTRRASPRASATPNVADILDLGEEHDTLYMDPRVDQRRRLVEALDRPSARRRQPFPLDLLLRIGADACAGLHAAHELRDELGNPLGVRPPRRLAAEHPDQRWPAITKVIDFGIAKAMDRTSEQTKTGTLKGKAQYAAPEQVRGKEIDRRIDIWAIGTILYHYLSGSCRTRARTISTLKMLTSGRPPPPLPPQVPPQVAGGDARWRRRPSSASTALDMRARSRR